MTRHGGCGPIAPTVTNGRARGRTPRRREPAARSRRAHAVEGPEQGECAGDRNGPAGAGDHSRAPQVQPETTTCVAPAQALPRRLRRRRPSTRPTVRAPARGKAVDRERPASAPAAPRARPSARRTRNPLRACTAPAPARDLPFIAEGRAVRNGGRRRRQRHRVAAPERLGARRRRPESGRGSVRQSLGFTFPIRRRRPAARPAGVTRLEWLPRRGDRAGADPLGCKRRRLSRAGPDRHQIVRRAKPVSADRHHVAWGTGAFAVGVRL